MILLLSREMFNGCGLYVWLLLCAKCQMKFFEDVLAGITCILI